MEAGITTNRTSEGVAPQEQRYKYIGKCQYVKLIS